ncbi:MAG: uracil-DNA glycosylase [Myxococcota bacterium]
MERPPQQPAERDDPAASETPSAGDELVAITRALRNHLEALSRAGRFSVSALPSIRPDLSDLADLAESTAPGPDDPSLSTDMNADRARSASWDRGEDAAAIAPGSLFRDMAQALEGDGRGRGGSRSASEHADRAAAESAQPSGRADPGADSHRPSSLTLAAVRAELGECQRCKLSRTRTKIVFGVGDERAPLMFVGEAPGMNEDRRGEPFVGAAGQLLDQMIAAMGWSRQTVYIANVLKCRPPNNRDPQPDEIAECRPFLAQQIAAVSPRILVSLGRPAAHLLLDTRAPISALRGRFQDYRGIPVMPTYHPAYLLRNPAQKRAAWSDLKQVIAEFERLGIQPPGQPKLRQR